MDNESIRVKIRKLNSNEISLNQRAFLLDCAVKLMPDMTEEAKDMVWKLSEFLTEGKYRWLLSLVFAGNKPGEDGWQAREKFKREIDQLIEL